MQDTSLPALLQRNRLLDPTHPWLERCGNATDGDLTQTLAQPMAPFSLQRLAVLLSPVARGRLEELAQAAHAVTRQRFGRTIGLYAPLYLSNRCSNRCRYCGFHADHDIERVSLSQEEALAEASLLAREGFRDLLLVSGEDPAHVSLPYLCGLARTLRSSFASISVEIYPLDEAGYRTLFEAGIDGVTLYQETYDPETYRLCHPTGPKSDYGNRLDALSRAARGGMRQLGMGVLLGLAPWRQETFCLALHADTLMRTHWQSRISISFPRLRPAPDAAWQPDAPVGDTDLVQMILALRLCFSDAGLVLSTREPALLRDQLLPLGITRMSAGSRTNPGGYGGEGGERQFEIADPRSAQEVAAHLRTRGYDPVWKDGDACFTPDTEA